MADIQLHPDGEQRRRIMDFIMAAGQTLLENGAEVFRVEQTMQIMARSLHLREFHVYVLTNGIFASAGTAEISEVRNVPVRTIHLGRVAAVNELSRELAEGRVGLDEAELQLAAARRIPFPRPAAQVLSGTVGSAAFSEKFLSTMLSHSSTTRNDISPCVTKHAPPPSTVTLLSPRSQRPMCLVPSGHSSAEAVFDT